MKNSIPKLKPIVNRTSEKEIEKYLVKRVEDCKGIAYKFSSPNRRNVPDRICVFPGGTMIFVEVKAPGKKPTDAQIREMVKLYSMGFLVTYVDSVGSIEEIIDFYKTVGKPFTSRMFS